MEANPTRLYLLSVLFTNDQVLTSNANAHLKEVILRRDERLLNLAQILDSRSNLPNATPIDVIHDVIQDEAHVLYTKLFERCSLDVAKSLSKTEREANDLEDEKSLIYGEVDFKCVTRPASISIESAPGTLLASFVR